MKKKWIESFDTFFVWNGHKTYCIFDPDKKDINQWNNFLKDVKSKLNPINEIIIGVERNKIEDKRKIDKKSIKKIVDEYFSEYFLYDTYHTDYGEEFYLRHRTNMSEIIDRLS